jgi:hypothetical protein
VLVVEILPAIPIIYEHLSGFGEQEVMNTLRDYIQDTAGEAVCNEPRADSTLVYGCHSEQSEESLAGLTRDPSLR